MASGARRGTQRPCLGHARRGESASKRNQRDDLPLPHALPMCHLFGCVRSAGHNRVLFLIMLARRGGDRRSTAFGLAGPHRRGRVGSPPGLGRCPARPILHTIKEMSNRYLMLCLNYISLVAQALLCTTTTAGTRLTRGRERHAPAHRNETFAGINLRKFAAGVNQHAMTAGSATRPREQPATNSRCPRPPARPPAIPFFPAPAAC